MKNVQLLIEKDDIHQYFRNYWQTEEFLQSHEQGEGSVIFDLVEKYAKLPRFIFDATNEEMETPHFSSWWSGFQRRVYSNAGIHDLYGGHEIWHSGNMEYVPGMLPPVFNRKLGDNELGASVFSEIEIYFAIPSLRDKTFPHEIYADRFLDDPKMQDWYRSDPDGFRKFLAYSRAGVMLGAPESDRTAYFISKFAAQNEIWFNVWKGRYNEVETAMAALQDDSKTMGRTDAMDKYISWLTSPEVTLGTDIPFPEEAEDFAASYMHLKKVYEREHKGYNPRKILPVSLTQTFPTGSPRP